MTESLFRSEEMRFVQLTMSEATAHSTLQAVGQLGCVHFNDMSGHDSKAGGDVIQSESYMHYKKRVAACFHWEKKLQTLRTIMTENGVEPPPLDYPEYARATSQYPDVVAACASFVEGVEEPLQQNLLFKKQQSQRIHELIERLHVLEKVRTEKMFRRRDTGASGGASGGGVDYSRDVEVGLLSGSASGGVAMDSKAVDASNPGAFTTVSGVIAVNRQSFFERMLFRVSRGNAISKFVPIEAPITDPSSGEEMTKSVFTIVFVGRQLAIRINKICQFVGATVIQVPADELSYNLEMQDIQRRIDDYTGVLDRTKQDITKLLTTIAYDENEKFPVDSKMGKTYNTFGNDMLKVSPLVNWEATIGREKAICDTMRKCILPPPGAKAPVVMAEGFVPAADAPKLAEVMRDVHEQTKQAVCEINGLEKYHTPPTYFRTNKFTDPFQSIVNTYGWPRYKEANPGLFTIFTFPFLFGIMYGDIGHGTLLTLFSLYLIWKEEEFLRKAARKELGEMFGMAFGGRYLLVAMGVCAVYCGIMYNDCFSIPWNVYGSTWKFTPPLQEAVRIGSVYPVGIDPAWYGTKNELTFFNSMKMKLAVTIGVTHMSFGLILQLTNHIYNGDQLGIWFEFLPQFLFMFCTFGYMIVLILLKLTTNWAAPGMISPPNLIQTMINMFLSPGTVTDDKKLYGAQAAVQTFFLLTALMSVPVMLLVRPCYEHFCKSKPHRDGGDRNAGVAHAGGDDALSDISDEKQALAGGDFKSSSEHEHSGKAKPSGGGHGGEGGEVTFGDLFIHQSIHTIEFVLGTVSNTASYLRLWALSLAHAELSTVFWDKMLMQYGILTGSPVMVVVGFAVWGAATFAVLLGMDVLECFLHALRLHWVEFQSKFFHADGYAFQPFDFKKPVSE